jgi:hypothetical protein
MPATLPALNLIAEPGRRAHYWAMPNYRNYWKEAGYLDEMTAAEAAIAGGRTDELPKYLTDRRHRPCCGRAVPWFRHSSLDAGS